MSVGFKRAHDHAAHGSGYTSHDVIDKVEKAIRAKVQVVRGVDVPYCAGYSEDGSKVYVDRDVPKVFKTEHGEIDVDRYLVIHEMVEWALMETLGLPYQYAHALATICEERAVQADGHDVAAYNQQWDRVIRKVGSRGKYPNVPKDLDTEPYTDEGDEKGEKEVGIMSGSSGNTRASDPYDYPAPSKPYGGKAIYRGKYYGR